MPVAAANLPDGRVLVWSATDRYDYGGGGRTYTAVYDPASGSIGERLVTETDHDMFCPGTTNLADGTLLINGGEDSTRTSFYDPGGGWRRGPEMNLGRGYQGNTLLADGSVLTYGGSWSGSLGGKVAEIWTPGGGWRRLPNVPAAPAEGPDPEGVYRGDNHFWLFPAPSGRVLQAGPSAEMHWIDTAGDGQLTSAGRRGDDGYSQNGNAVMYDVGRILKVGGSTAYDGAAASSASYLIDINGGASVRRVASMAYARVFANAVVLPGGKVMVVGGQTRGRVFSDDNSVLVPELWDPATESFTQLPPLSVPRNYHSVALLLPDARVLAGGGGLCGVGCPANHADVQIYSPYYLFNADGSPAARPAITGAPGSAAAGATIEVAVDAPVTAFELLRLSSVTHTVNNDQRRVPLAFGAGSGVGRYALRLPGNRNVLLPGLYMLFALNAAGVPSVAHTLRIE